MLMSLWFGRFSVNALMLAEFAVLNAESVSFWFIILYRSFEMDCFDQSLRLSSLLLAYSCSASAASPVYVCTL